MHELKNNSNVRKCFETRTWHAIVDTDTGIGIHGTGMRTVSRSPTVTSLYIPLLLWDHTINSEVVLGVVLFVLKDEFRSYGRDRRTTGIGAGHQSHHFSHYKTVESVVTSNLQAKSHPHSNLNTGKVKVKVDMDVPGAFYISQLTEVCDLMHQSSMSSTGSNMEASGVTPVTPVTPAHCQFISLCTSLTSTLHTILPHTTNISTSTSTSRSRSTPIGHGHGHGYGMHMPTHTGIGINANEWNNPLWKLYEWNYHSNCHLNSVQASFMDIQEKQYLDIEIRNSFINENKTELTKVLTENEVILNKKEKDIGILIVDRNNAINKYQLVKQVLYIYIYIYIYRLYCM